jgi:GntR family transcriptional regulator, transcriptional repressor for pyruvate dehydrogenase complex
VQLSDKRTDRFLGGSTGPEPDVLTLHRVVRRTAVDEVRSQLVTLIELGHLQVNDRLPAEAELSRRFGVSRQIVREALGRLQALGLTESRPGSGTFVASNVTRLLVSVGQHSASDLNEVRRCLEVPAARLAAIRRTSKDLEELTLCLERHERATTAEETVRRDSDFHCAVARATGNMLFRRLIDDFQEILEQQSLTLSTLRTRGAAAAREHRHVFQAIVAGDGAGAAAAMDQHLDAVERAVRKLEHRSRPRSDATSMDRPTTGEPASSSRPRHRTAKLPPAGSGPARPLRSRGRPSGEVGWDMASLAPVVPGGGW